MSQEFIVMRERVGTHTHIKKGAIDDGMEQRKRQSIEKYALTNV